MYLSSDFGNSSGQRASYSSDNLGWPDFRFFRATGDGDWVASVRLDVGMLEYQLASVQNMEALQSVSLELMYSYNFPDAFSLGNVTFFSFGFENVEGIGELITEKREPGSGDYISITNPIQFSQPGTLLLPVTQSDLSGINLLRFTVTPKTSEFSFRLDEISVIPEPTIWSLLLLGGSPWVWRRVKTLASRKLW